MKLLSLVKAAYNAPVNGMPTVGPKQYGIHALRGLSFAIWCVQVSRLTGMVAYCGADGTVRRFQLTAKVEKDPARNSPLHFICGSLTIGEDGRAVVVHTPLPHIPPTSKKLGCDVGNNSRVLQGFSSESYHTKGMNNNRAKCTEAENQALVLSYGVDPDLESEPEETLAVFTRKNKAKSKNSKDIKLGEDQTSACGDDEQDKSKDKAKSKNQNKNKLGEDRALILRDEEQDTVPKKEGEMGGAGNESKVIPPKLVAIHRVRWNMNKGSERWLCSGGAAGIVRCQEVVFSVADKWFARKR
uniref:Uncharacterized protein MANES_13G012000 n=1 Tax=Rhizophora mucronata TaxID=61149 RepID=A0A2P2P1V1_RHIMU